MTSTRAASRSNGFQAMYYCQVDKLGSLFRGGTKVPYTEYQVNGDWILNLVQARKLSLSTARHELVRCMKNLPRNLQALDLWWAEERKVRLLILQDQVSAELSKNTRASRRVEQVDAWTKQYDEVLRRYKFLVLDGPTRMGKTEFTKTLVKPGHFFEINMSAAPEPNLREYDHEKHELILFDECHVEVILKQKRLFQAPACLVNLGASATNCFAYQVWVHRKRLVVTSNVWKSSLTALTTEDREWIERNSIYVYVSEPLYVQTPASGAGRQ